MIGEDIIEGDMLFPVNHKIRTLDTGMFLSAGITHVHVRRKPSILIIPTGKELIDIYDNPTPDSEIHRLVDFNSYLLVNMAEEIGFRAEKSKILITREELLATVHQASQEFDVIIVNAGSSAGTDSGTMWIILSDTSEKPARTRRSAVQAVAVSPDSHFLAAADGAALTLLPPTNSDGSFNFADYPLLPADGQLRFASPAAERGGVGLNRVSARAAD